MRKKLFFETDAGIERICRFLASFGLPAPIVVRGWRRRIVLLTDLHRLQLNALRIGWKNLRSAKAELKQAAV